jgi:hypothetical protein
MPDLQYPIGKFKREPVFTPAERPELIQHIADAPGNLRRAVAGLSQDRLDTPYRPGGWTVKQVVHHLPDSHMNAYVRMKLALTETQPTIKPYKEALWAELFDARTAPVEHSIILLESLHNRWIWLLRSLTADDFSKTLLHPEHGVINLDFLLQLYAWHGRHHVAHITSLRERMAWH